MIELEAEWLGWLAGVYVGFSLDQVCNYHREKLRSACRLCCKCCGLIELEDVCRGRSGRFGAGLFQIGIRLVTIAGRGSGWLVVYVVNFVGQLALRVMAWTCGKVWCWFVLSQCLSG